MHKLSKSLLSGKSTYGSRETELYSGARRMFRESRMCLRTIHYIYATKGEITGMIAPAMVILSIQVATVFASEGCNNLVWRASHYFQNMFTLGARDFSCAVSGFGQVLKSDPRGRTRVGLRPTKRSSPSHARKNLWYPG